ncbi:50S ribosomal protein L15 [bioreactor metagenome]|uniref:50S ribosomal protein L15 n=1 Tax=bioreactor metagenome TaxID=1076179 RepID=A0A645BK23_9ZZZZ
MKLHDLMPNEGSKKVGKRKGHGISAGQGKTSGRGTKGLGARAGSGGALYRQGGNLPFFRRLPFMRGEGFTPPSQVEFNEINLDQLTRFQASSVITPAILAEARLLHKPGNPVVILGRGEITAALTLQVQRVTDSARAKIEAAGGKVELIA